MKQKRFLCFKVSKPLKNKSLRNINILLHFQLTYEWWRIPKNIIMSLEPRLGAVHQ